MKSSSWERRQQLAYHLIDIGDVNDFWSKAYDILYTISIIINLFVSIAITFDAMELQYGPLLKWTENLTVGFFTIDYVLRIWTAKLLYRMENGWKAYLKYQFSFNGIIDFLSVVPYWAPMFFPAGAAAFRMLRVIRIFRLFRINAYYDSLNVITEVLNSKKQQLISSVFIIVILMIASSLCMYSVEHDAQPDVFQNAFSGIWWSVSTLLTVGYGDIYPITFLGKVLSIVITFLGVGMVAIPTGIISAGFVDQYSRIKRMSDYATVDDFNFIKITLAKGDQWAGKEIRNIGLPKGIIMAAIHRNNRIVVPKGDVSLQVGDHLVLGAESFAEDKGLELKEITLKHDHEWNGHKIRDLDISRQTIIVMIKRKGRTLVPSGDLTLFEGDEVVMYHRHTD